MDVNSQRIQAVWYCVNTLDTIDANYSWGKSLYSNDGSMNLQVTTNASIASSAYDIDLAPQCPRSTLGMEEQYIGLIGVYLNPVTDELTVHFAWSNHGKHIIEVIDLNDRVLLKEDVMTIPLNSANKTIDVSALNSGDYLLKFSDLKGNTVSSKFVKN